MIRDFRAAVVVSAMLTSLSIISIAQSKQAPVAPIPAQILVAKKVFIANAGGDEMFEDDPIFTGGPARAYNEFYAAIKEMGRFEIVGSPAEADLLLEVRAEVLTVGLGYKSGASYTPSFHLQIRDPKSNALLWGFHVHSQFGAGQGNSDRNFDQAVDRLVNDLRALITPAPASASAVK